ncbi:hypothetical protein JTE90_018613 [Oedothorax gibbosus]|uniref:Sialic acid synthase n=1 Tax=Oedothorax gibbosus TaxID=931172 RepID=A0AAV6UP86_9ARAC|nr:hypothetical protein JTE90_018613 [Oedothorax gibbosus]
MANLKLNPIVEIAPGRNIGGNWPCFIIAEIGQNHQGDVKIAKQLIKIAKYYETPTFLINANQGSKKSRIR